MLKVVKNQKKKEKISKSEVLSESPNIEQKEEEIIMIDVSSESQDSNQIVITPLTQVNGPHMSSYKTRTSGRTRRRSTKYD